MRVASRLIPQRPIVWLCSFVLLSWAVVVQADPATPEPSHESLPYFAVETLAEGVFLFVPEGPGPLRANSLVVQREAEVLVVDAQPTPEAATLLLELIPRYTSGPVRYLVLSHAHAEASGGAGAFPESTIVIASAAYRDAMADPAFDYGAEARWVAGDSWVEPARTLPDLVLSGHTEVEGSLHPLRLLPIENAHAPGDLIVEIPDANLLYAGGIVFPDGNPYASSATVSTWVGVLTYLIESGPSNVVGVRGRLVKKDDLRRQRDALAWVQGQVEQGFIDRLPLEKIEERVLDEPELGQRFNTLVVPSFLPRLVKQVIEESAEHRRKRGRPIPGESPEPRG